MNDIVALWLVEDTPQCLLVDAERVLVVEGRVAGKHLENQDAECPPVDGPTVALGLVELSTASGSASTRCRVIFLISVFV